MNYLQRQDIEGGNLTIFSNAFDEQDTDHEVKALRAALKEREQRLEEKDQRLSALESKFDSFSHEPREGNTRKKPTRKECDNCKKPGKWAQDHDESHQGEACRKRSPGDHE